MKQKCVKKSWRAKDSQHGITVYTSLQAYLAVLACVWFKYYMRNILHLLVISVSALFSIYTNTNRAFLWQLISLIIFVFTFIYSRYKCGTFCHVYSSSVHQWGFKLNGLLSFYDPHCNFKQTSIWSASKCSWETHAYIIFSMCLTFFFFTISFFNLLCQNKVLLKFELVLLFCPWFRLWFSLGNMEHTIL